MKQSNKMYHANIIWNMRACHQKKLFKEISLIPADYAISSNDEIISHEEEEEETSNS